MRATALDAGGSETLYDDIERFEASALLDRASEGGAALRRRVDLVARRISTRDVAAGVRAHFSDAEAVELTLDVMRNASNKIAVAWAATRRGSSRAPSGICLTWTVRRCSADCR